MSLENHASVTRVRASANVSDVSVDLAGRGHSGEVAVVTNVVPIARQIAIGKSKADALSYGLIVPPPTATESAPGRGYLFVKRTYDLLGGLVLLAIALPIICIAALYIWCDSKGSPLFVQTRLGENGRLFKIFKLRGMYRDSKVRFASYYDYSGKKNLDFCFHHAEDPRVTRAGRFIRKTSIDELPNLWNVVMGEMSLVGPRPEIPEVMALYGAYREQYLSVKPGITCFSKVTGRDKLTKRETIEFDLDYIRKRSFRVDASILWRTFSNVILRRDVF